MNRFRTCTIFAGLVLCSAPLVQAGTPQMPDSTFLTREDLSKEASQIQTLLERAFAETRLQLDQFEQQEITFQHCSGNLLERLRAFRFHLQQRRNYLKEMQSLIAKYDKIDTTRYAQAAWQEFAINLGRELSIKKWSYEGDFRGDYDQLIDQYNVFIIQLNNSAINYPSLITIANKLIKYAGSKPLKATDVTDGERAIAALQEMLLREPWGADVYDFSTSTLAKGMGFFDKVNGQLLDIESFVVEFHNEIGSASAQLERRLAKLEGLLASLQGVEKKLQRREISDLAYTQQLLFIRNQYQFVDYPHHVIKSSAGEIESALREKRWKSLLELIATQDPEFGQIDLEKNVYVLFVGVDNLNQRFLLHEENGAPSEYLYAIDTAYAIWLEDNPQETYAIDLSTNSLQPALEADFSNRTFKEAETAKVLPSERGLFFYNIEKISRLRSAAQINLTMRRIFTPATNGVIAPGAANASSYATSAEEVFQSSYQIHAKSRAHLSFGLAAGLVERADFVVTGNKLKISAKGEKELDQQFYALFNLHLGAHDLDRFQQYSLLDFRKFMLQAGLGLSSNPLDKIYAGLGYRLSVAVQIDVLHFWSREPNREQTVSLDNATSIEDAKSKFGKNYYPGNFALGISFYPRRLFGFLGW